MIGKAFWIGGMALAVLSCSGGKGSSASEDIDTLDEAPAVTLRVPQEGDMGHINADGTVTGGNADLGEVKTGVATERWFVLMNDSKTDRGLARIEADNADTDGVLSVDTVRASSIVSAGVRVTSAEAGEFTRTVRFYFDGLEDPVAYTVSGKAVAE